jgi:hypothetical protein
MSGTPAELRAVGKVERALRLGTDEKVLSGFDRSRWSRLHKDDGKFDVFGAATSGSGQLAIVRMLTTLREK